MWRHAVENPQFLSIFPFFIATQLHVEVLLQLLIFRTQHGWKLAWNITLTYLCCDVKITTAHPQNQTEPSLNLSTTVTEPSLNLSTTKASSRWRAQAVDPWWTHSTSEDELLTYNPHAVWIWIGWCTVVISTPIAKVVWIGGGIVANCNTVLWP
jgi:hypothetical protein